jgi:hypothetical protein
MKYLRCKNCNNQIPLKTEFITFCNHCSQKIEMNFQVWKLSNPRNSFADYCLQFGEEEEVINLEPKKKTKGLLIYAVVFALISVIGGVSIDYYLNHYEPDLTSDAILNDDWNSQSLGAVFLFDSPYDLEPFDLPAPPEALSLMENWETYKSNASGGLQIIASHFKTKAEAGFVNLQGAALGSIAQMQNQPGIANFKYKEKAIQKGKKKGVFQTGSYQYQGQQLEFTNTLYVEGPDAWSIITIYPVGDSAGREASERLIESIRFDENVRV